MSWNPLKRLGTPKPSIISTSDERDFERQLDKLHRLDEVIKKVTKDMKKYTETITGVYKCESKLVQDLSGSNLLYTEEKLRNNVLSWQNATGSLENCTAELNNVSKRGVIEPMKKFGSVFTNVNLSARKWEQSLQECNKCMAKVDKLQERERTGANLVKISTSKRALEQVKQEFETLNQTLMNDMPKLYDSRIEYFQPCLEALIKSEVVYYTEIHKAYTELGSSICANNDPTPENVYNDWLQQKISEMKALSVVPDD